MWAKKNGYHQNQVKATKIYCLAKSGIPTISSGSPTTKIMMQKLVKVLERVVNKVGVRIGGIDKKLMISISNFDKNAGLAF